MGGFLEGWPSVRLMTRVYAQLYINGKWVPSAGEGVFEVTDSATEEVIATVPNGATADVDAAVAAAKAAFPAWSATPKEQRPIADGAEVPTQAQEQKMPVMATAPEPEPAPAPAPRVEPEVREKEPSHEKVLASPAVRGATKTQSARSILCWRANAASASGVSKGWLKPTETTRKRPGPRPGTSIVSVTHLSHWYS